MVGLVLRQAASSGDSGRTRWQPLVCTATCDCGATSAIDDTSKLELRSPSSTHDSSVACQVGLNSRSNGYGVLGHWRVAATRTCRSSDATTRRDATTYAALNDATKLESQTLSVGFR